MYDTPINLIKKEKDYHLFENDFQSIKENDAFLFGNYIFKHILMNNNHYKEKTNHLFYINLGNDNLNIIPFDYVSEIKVVLNRHQLTNFTLEEIFQSYSEGAQVIKNLLNVIDNK